jgi:GT2 family glycosyltransferase
MSMPTLGIVILNWNGEEFLKVYLPKLLSYTQIYGVSIIVADNASTDSSLKLLNDEFPEVQILSLEKNYGFAGGYNKALAQIDTDYYILLNSDVEVTENWINPMIQYLEDNCDVAACQPKILSIHEPSKFEHAGACGGFIDVLGYPFCRGRIFHEIEYDNGQYDSNIDVFWASGACLMIRSKVFWELGGFDDDFFAHMEEIDLCWRVQGMNYRVVCVAESTVYHVGGGTLQTDSPYKTYLNYRNNLAMLYKNLPDHKLNSVLFIRRIFDMLSILLLVLKGKWSNASSIIKARKDFAQQLDLLKIKRLKIQESRLNNNIKNIYSKSIVFDFFIRRKMKFSQLNFKILD